LKSQFVALLALQDRLQLSYFLPHLNIKHFSKNLMPTHQ
jgi:hypothetical protein